MSTDIDTIHAGSGWGVGDAALHLLRSRRLEDKTRAFISDGGKHIDWDGLDAEVGYWSSGEQLLVAVARNFWTGKGAVNLDNVISTLDVENFALFLEAVELRRVA